MPPRSSLAAALSNARLSPRAGQKQHHLVAAVLEPVALNRGPGLHQSQPRPAAAVQIRPLHLDLARIEGHAGVARLDADEGHLALEGKADYAVGWSLAMFDDVGDP